MAEAARSHHSAPTLADYASLLLLSAIWGASFLFLRMTSAPFGPLFLIELRMLTALVALLPVFLITGKLDDLLQNWGKIFIASLITMAVPFCLLAFATLSIGAGLASIINASVPFFTAILGFLLFRQALSFLGVLGLVIGFAGVVVLAVEPAGSGGDSGEKLLAVAAGLVASFLYGLGANYTARYLQGISGLAITTGCLIYSSLYLAPFAYLQQPEVMPTGPIWWAVITLGAICTGLAFVMFYRLIARIGSTRTVTVTLLAPMFSIVWGWMILDEQLTLVMAFGSVLVLSGVAMTTGKIPGRRAAQQTNGSP